MASNKKTNIPISSLSSDEIYAILDSIENDEEEDIENDSDTEFVDRSIVENKEFCAFLDVNLLMGINKLPTTKSYWSVDEGLGNSLIQKAMTRARFLEILQNIHFADNHKELPPKESEEYDHASKLRPLFDHLGKHFQDMLQPEAHQSTDENICKFKGKSIMRNT